MVEHEETLAELVRLKARVRELEEVLRRRSAVLRTLERELCPRDSALLTRIAAGGSTYPGSGLSLLGAGDTIRLESSEVEATLAEVWRSLEAPPGRAAE